jgi:hypothetical protein
VPEVISPAARPPANINQTSQSDTAPSWHEQVHAVTKSISSSTARSNGTSTSA